MGPLFLETCFEWCVLSLKHQIMLGSCIGQGQGSKITRWGFACEATCLVEETVARFEGRVQKGGGDGWKAVKSRVFGAGGWTGVADKSGVR